MDLEPYRERAYGTALSLLGDHHLAEDAVQEAFVEAHRAWGSLRDPAKRAAWVRGIVRHRCFRILRGRDAGAAPLPDLASTEEPWQAAACREEAADVLDRVRRLPRPLREVVVLHYLRDCPHRDVAAFLDVPVTTVNNRLHLARRLLKGGDMKFDTPEVGTVLRGEGPLLDVQFDPDAAPDAFDVLTPADRASSLRVTQVLGEGVVRCLLVRGTAPEVGGRLVNRTATGGTYLADVASDERLAEAVAALGEPRRGMFETGIKPIDLFCPLPARGTVGIFGTSGTGKMVLTQELVHRCRGKGPRLFYLADRPEPALIRDLRQEGEALDRDVVWVLSDRVTDPEFAAARGPFDAAIYCSPLLAIRGLWPAVDPFHSRSAVEVGERHARVARAARDLLAAAHSETLDPTVLEYLACRAYDAARRRLAAAPPPATVVARRAGLLEAYLTTPFHVASEANGIPGQDVHVSALLEDVEAILAGALDDRDPKDLRFVGRLVTS